MTTRRALVALLVMGGSACASNDGSTKEDVSTSSDTLGAEAAQGAAAEQAARRHVRVAQAMVRTDLVSDQAGAKARDPNLVNAWGLAFSASGPAWVSDNGTGLASVYDANGVLRLTVTVPTASGAMPPSKPSGQVRNDDASAFMGDRFVIVTEDGTISGWQPGGARLRVDRSSDGAVYKGATIAHTKDGPRLYAANFHAGTVDVFDASYAPVHPASCRAFRDPALPPHYAPFNVEEAFGLVLVAYAQQGDGPDDVKGPGHGFVDLFDARGKLLERLVSRGALDSPWGMTFAPRHFGHVGGRLLVGNFGDGRVNVYDIEPRWRGLHIEHEGVLGDARGAPLVIEGLWALRFANDAGGFRSDQLYFTAGPSDEEHGVLGRLELH